MNRIVPSRWIPATVVLVLAACGTDTPERWNVSIREIASPAGEGSGEPHLAAHGGDVYLSWQEQAADGAHDLRFARWAGDGWSEPSTIHSSDRFFVNWADFPTITPTDEGAIWAHWLQRGDAGGYDYGIRVVRSEDGGAGWSEPWKPHEDDTPTEHGFVSALPMTDGGVGFVWLDGRKYVDGPQGPATQEMTLRWRAVDAAGRPGPEVLLDARVCDCCQTGAAMTAAGPIVVYRDRSPEEIRDIYVTRLVGDAWTEGVPVHADGWEIAGCPVNGPQVAARGERVAVAWFAAPEDRASVKVAFSEDSGATFAPPVVVDDGNPAGRVDVLFSDDDAVVVSWLERTGGEGAEVRVRRVAADGTSSGSVTVSSSSSERASGFPRMAPLQGGGLLLAWTDVAAGDGRIRVARLDPER